MLGSFLLAEAQRDVLGIQQTNPRCKPRRVQRAHSPAAAHPRAPRTPRPGAAGCLTEGQPKIPQVHPLSLGPSRSFVCPPQNFTGLAGRAQGWPDGGYKCWEDGFLINPGGDIAPSPVSNLFAAPAVPPPALSPRPAAQDRAGSAAEEPRDGKEKQNASGEGNHGSAPPVHWNFQGKPAPRGGIYCPLRAKPTKFSPLIIWPVMFVYRAGAKGPRDYLLLFFKNFVTLRDNFNRDEGKRYLKRDC